MTPSNIRQAILDKLGNKTVAASALRAAVKKAYPGPGIDRLYEEVLARMEMDGEVELVGMSGAFKYRKVVKERVVTAADLMARAAYGLTIPTPKKRRGR